MSGAPLSIAAERTVPAAPRTLFAFLTDLQNHWQLADRFVEVRTLERPPGGGPATGGTVTMRGPMGLGVTARTRVVEAHPDTSMAGTASVGARTEAHVRWTLTPVEHGTRVRLQATVERVGVRERLLLAAGGRGWLERRFASILDTLAARMQGGEETQDSAA